MMIIVLRIKEDEEFSWFAEVLAQSRQKTTDEDC